MKAQIPRGPLLFPAGITAYRLDLFHMRQLCTLIEPGHLGGTLPRYPCPWCAA